jgi:arginase family enzyme
MTDIVALRLLRPGRLIPSVGKHASFMRIGLDELTRLLGTNGIIKKIRDRVGTVNPVYLSIDIDTLDPACKSTLSLHVTNTHISEH